MKSIVVTGPGTVEWADIPDPEFGPSDVVVKVKACGICGSDLFYIQIGGVPPRRGCTCLGHEPAGEVVAVGTGVAGVKAGDHVVLNPLGMVDGILGNGGAQGALSEFVVVRQAQPGKNLRVIPRSVPFAVAALNEPMAVALHGVNRTQPKPGNKVVVFGAGPIGMGCLLGYRRKGVEDIVVVDIVQSRLDKAMKLGARATINSATTDLAEALIALHGEASGMGSVGGPRSATDIYMDAAGARQVVESAMALAGSGATLGIVGVHKEPVPVNFQAILRAELTIAMSMGYPTEIFEVTDDIIENTDSYAQIISDLVPYADALDGIARAGTPGATEKVVITLP